MRPARAIRARTRVRDVRARVAHGDASDVRARVAIDADDADASRGRARGIRAREGSAGEIAGALARGDSRARDAWTRRFFLAVVRVGRESDA